MARRRAQKGFQVERFSVEYRVFTGRTAIDAVIVVTE
jgi:hypothetical protein